MDAWRACVLVAAVVALAGCSDVVAPDPRDVALQIVAEGLQSPVDLAAPPDDVDRIFIVEKPGRIRIVRDGSLLPTAFLDISGLTSGGSEQGLLGLAFHPSFATNGYFYVDYTDGGGDTRIVRYTVSANPDVADPASALPILSQPQPFSNHNGGRIAFGPDGMLYIGMGDGGSGGDPQGHGQNPATLLGSILRIDVDAGSPYAIPADNPFVSHPTARRETWAYGLRNPWRFSFDRATGDLYIGDVGQNALEEISFQPGGSGGGVNYGWNTMEGSACYSPATGCDPTGLEPPIFEYSHGEGCSVSGGYVYRGTDVPGLTGRYLFADFCETWVRSFRLSGGVAVDLIDHSAEFGQIPGIVSFGEDALGELYVISLDGTVYKIGPL